MHNSHFPDIDTALEEPNGLLAQGGELNTTLLLDAYQHGIFPWPSPMDEDEQLSLLWWSPDPRAVIFCDNIYCSKSLLRDIRRSTLTLSLNRDFKQVIHHCASIPRKSLYGENNDTWISNEIQEAYIDLHQQGFAHSIEVWDEDQLVGGLYGVLTGQIFCGESMFHQTTNASKIALFALAKHMQNLQWPLIDCQIENPHLRSLGAETISREAFKRYLPAYQNDPINALQSQEEFIKTWHFSNVKDLATVLP